MPLSKDYEFSSERLRFRGIRAEDAEAIVRWRSDPDNYRNFFVAKPISLEEHLAWFGGYLDDATRFDFMVLDPEGRPIGTVGLSNIDEERGTCEISYMIGDKAARGKGYASEAVRVLTDVAFSELGIESVDARILPGNAASMKVVAGGGIPSMSGSSGGPAARPVLLLTNNDNTMAFHEWLALRGEDVVRLGGPLDADMAAGLSPRFAVSFNYRHILKQDAIDALGCPVVNVHCSVLPWNRGAAPNFFSYYENTPKGVTVHELTAGLDKGDVLLQRVLPLGEEETFASSYDALIAAAVDLLEENWEELASGGIEGTPQGAGGSYHSVGDLEAVRSRFPFEWGDRVSDWKARHGLE